MNKWPFCPNANCLFVTALRAQCQNKDKITLKYKRNGSIEEAKVQAVEVAFEQLK